LKKLLAGFLIVAGSVHFLKMGSYVKIVPPYVPFPEMVVLGSGAVCSFLGAALLLPRVSRVAAWGIVIYLMAVFPANIHMAFHPEIFPAVPVWILWARLPLQAVLIAWAYCYTRK
jgi:uncharacterized membrane protein